MNIASSPRCRSLLPLLGAACALLVGRHPRTQRASASPC